MPKEMPSTRGRQTGLPSALLELCAIDATLLALDRSFTPERRNLLPASIRFSVPSIAVEGEYDELLVIEPIAALAKPSLATGQADG